HALFSNSNRVRRLRLSRIRICCKRRRKPHSPARRFRRSQKLHRLAVKLKQQNLLRPLTRKKMKNAGWFSAVHSKVASRRKRFVHSLLLKGLIHVLPPTKAGIAW